MDHPEIAQSELPPRPNGVQGELQQADYAASLENLPCRAKRSATKRAASPPKLLPSKQPRLWQRTPLQAQVKLRRRGSRRMQQAQGLTLRVAEPTPLSEQPPSVRPSPPDARQPSPPEVRRRLHQRRHADFAGLNKPEGLTS